MPKLPFLTPPAEPEKRRCGNSVSGVIELPVLGGLTVGESALIAELTADSESTLVHGARLADAIAKKEDIAISEAFNIIEASAFGGEMEPEAEAIRERHAAQITEIVRLYGDSDRQQRLATVTALLRCRLNLPSWGLDDTRSLLEPLFSDVLRLANEEREAEDREPAPAPDDELLGKPPEESGKRRRRTGTRSDGS